MFASRFAVTLALTAVLGSTLTFAPAGPAAADAGQDAVTLDGASVPALVGAEQGFALLGARAGVGVNPSVTVFSAAVGVASHTQLLVDTAGLAAGTQLAEATLTLGDQDGPGSTARITAVAEDGTQTLWGVEGDGAESATGLTIAQNGSADLSWSFDRPGTYTVEVLAAITLADTAPTDAAAAEPAEPIEVAASYIIEVAAAADDADGAAPDSTDAPVEPTTGAPSVQESAPIAAAPQTVIAAGDIRIANQIEDGRLTQGLVDVGADEATTVLDPASTVLTIPSSERWPGAAEDARTWEQAAPGKGPVYRSSAGSFGINDLMLSIDSTAIAPDAVVGSPGWGDSSGGLFSRLGAVSGAGDAALLQDGSEFKGSSTAGPATALWIETSPPGGFLYEPLQSFALAFEQAGRYCVTIETMAQLNTDGSVLNHDLILTLAVGDIDPATVAPCAQPAGIPSAPFQPSANTKPGTIVLDAGEARIASTLDEQGLSLDIVTLDRGRSTSHDPDDVVLSVPVQDTRWPGQSGADAVWQLVAPTGTRLWRTIGNSSDSEVGERSNALEIAFEGAYIDASQLDDSDNIAYDLKSVTTPDSGYVATYQTNGGGGIDDPAQAAIWDSRPGGRRDVTGTAAANRDMGVPFASIRPGTNPGTMGFAFSAPGVYCLAVGNSANLADGSAVEDAGTLTFAVGVDASTAKPCAQGGGTDPGDDTDPSDPTDPVDPGTGDLDPTVTWFDHGHLDLKARVDDAGDFGLASIGDAYDQKPVSLDDSVWVANSRFTSFTVPEPDDLQDLTFLGDPGDKYYGFSSSPTYVATALWPGLNTQGLPAAYYDRAFTWTVHDISGPGDVSVYSGVQKSEAVEYFDSRHLPSSFTTGNSHVHENWSFTEPGVYCIDLTVTARPTGQSTNEVAAGRLTVAVGDIDLSTVQPCGRTDPPATPTEVTPKTLDDTKTVVAGGVTGRSTRVDLSLNKNIFDVAASTSTDIGSARQVTDVEQVVWDFAKSGPTWHHLQEWSALDIPVGALRGDVSLTLGKVTGPGDYYVDESRLVGSATPTLDTRAGRELQDETVFPERLTRMNQQFTAAGVYCLPFTWSATTADGTAIAVTKTLTVAAGVDDPAKVELCADGGEGTDPGEGPDTDPGTSVNWDVPNHSTTLSGATIITDGHVDIASRVQSGALTTAIKDDSDAIAGPVYRDPAKVVLQIRPAAEATIPAQPEFAFLGAAGSTVWQVDQVQQEGLLWPGWSTELIGDNVITGGVQWSLSDVEGPGEFALYETNLGAPSVLFNTRDGITAADSFLIPQHVHAHGTWAFSAEGVYCLAFERATTLTAGGASTSDFVLAVAVGRTDVKRVDPGLCFTAPAGEPTSADTTPIPAAQLTDATTGGVQVLGGGSGFTPGQLVTIQLGKAHAGDWMSVWLHSDPTWLGWKQVGASGAVQVRLPADAATGIHKLVVKTQGGPLFGWDALSIAAAVAPATPTPGIQPDTVTPAATAVAATQCVAGATILSSGHIDYATRIVGGQLRSLVGDDSSGTKVYREPAGVVLWLKPEGKLVLPSGYGQVGQAGSTVWQVPQTQNAGLIWLGWNTEALNAGNAASPVSWSLDSVEGPGAVTVYTSGSFGGVQQIVLAGDGSTYSIPLGVHAHANWAFSAEGIYRLKMTQTTTLANGSPSSDTQTLTVAVGDVNPASAVAGSGTGCGTISNAVLTGGDTIAAAGASAEQAAVEAAESGRTVLPGHGTVSRGFTDPLQAFAEGNPVPLLLTVLGGLLLAAAGFGGVLLWRRRGARSPVGKDAAAAPGAA
ncbi:putative ABC transporter-associated repeat protein [Cryobacterium sp. MP_3.1]|uniref:TIGR03773 family transporter-associated surface protein n=1 Tax=Cryobacterium sp. MP_3.1 TaxID=3071711 RepID=UPI002DFB1A46|nr:putative ABC transporter-associated repeat protein [Cryobacterium sp. MP_3.1]